jgi:hypothetical protein
MICRSAILLGTERASYPLLPTQLRRAEVPPSRSIMMKWRGRKRSAIYYSVGWPLPDDALSTFSELRLPDATVRLLDKRVHRKALDNAGRKVSDFLRRSGRGRKRQ